MPEEKYARGEKSIKIHAEYRIWGSWRTEVTWGGVGLKRSEENFIALANTAEILLVPTSAACPVSWRLSCPEQLHCSGEKTPEHVLTEGYWMKARPLTYWSKCSLLRKWKTAVSFCNFKKTILGGLDFFCSFLNFIIFFQFPRNWKM